ncbi:MAG: hypothetical protein ACSHX8_09130 [Opitutaceae bacterium]
MKVQSTIGSQFRPPYDRLTLQLRPVAATIPWLMVKLPFGFPIA